MSGQTFETKLGWCGVAWSAAGLTRIVIAAKTRDDAALDLQNHADVPAPKWLDDLVARIILHMNGEPQTFTEFPVDLSAATPFRRQVYQALRTVGAGEVVTYGDLAKRLNKPGASRAIGGAMANNPLPLVVPCHRVMGHGESLVGFSAPGGVATKRAMLEREGIVLRGQKEARPASFFLTPDSSRQRSPRLAKLTQNCGLCSEP